MGQIVGAATAMSMVRLTVNEEIIAKTMNQSVLGLPRLKFGFSTMNGFYAEVFLSSLLVYIVLKYGDAKSSKKGFYWVETYAITRAFVVFLSRPFILTGKQMFNILIPMLDNLRIGQI